MRDGLYWVVYKGLCAGFVWKNGQLRECAPALRKRFDYWRTIAVYIGD